MDTPDRTPRRVRGGNGKFARSADTAERDAAACRLRNLNHDYAEIAAELGFTDRSAARKAVERAMLAIVQEPAAEQRAMQLARLDLMAREVWTVLKAEHIAVNNGRVIMDPSDPDRPLKDYGPVLASIDRLLRIEERRAKLLGLDAPLRAELITVDMVDAEMDRLARELGLNDHRPVAS